MTALTDFFDFLLPNLPNVGRELATQALRESVTDFCEKSLLWTYVVPPISVVGLTHTYALTPEAGARVADVLEVWHAGKALDPATPAELDAKFSDWRTTQSGVPDYYLSNVDNSSVRLVLTPSVSAPSGLSVTIAQAPLVSATEVPDWLFQRYHMAVSFGAWARLLAMPRRPWTDKEAAREYEKAFEQECGKANVRKAKAFTRKPLRTRTNFR